jgi:hypothetical protein
MTNTQAIILLLLSIIAFILAGKGARGIRKRERKLWSRLNGLD